VGHRVDRVGLRREASEAATVTARRASWRASWRARAARIAWTARVACVGLVGATAIAPRPALAQDADAKRRDAKDHFDKGVALATRGMNDAALAEFLASRAALPTRAATKNAALALRALGRFAEAQAMLEALLREFPDVTGAERDAAEKELREVARNVGTITIRASESGALVLVDSRERGTTPLAAPLRVSAGSHVVRVYKAGFSAFERSVDVAGGQPLTLDAHLAPLELSGRMKVVESQGKAADVFVDHVLVGKAPWEGPLAPGAHVVFLRGEGSLGTQPAPVTVKLNQVEPIMLALEPLDCELRVDVEPINASVALDGVALGHGVWEGKLRCGSHRVEAFQEGFLAATRDATLTRGDRATLPVRLERDPSSPMWGGPSGRFSVELAGSAWLAPSLGGDVASSCTGACARAFGAGGAATVHALYTFRSGLGIGLGVGVAQVAQKTTGRATSLAARGIGDNPGTSDDDVRVRGLLAGAVASYRVGDAWPFSIRLGGGVLLGSARDARTGSFTTLAGASSPSPVAYAVDATESASTRLVYLAPELRIGRRFGDHWELALAAQAMLFFPLGDAPSWKPEDSVVVTGRPCAQGAAPPACGTNGEAVFPSQSLLGTPLLVIAPGLAARYEF
jgi:hypothetical protein